MKMSGGINLRYATQMSAENRAYTIRNILTKAAKTASLRRRYVLPAQILAAGKFCLEDQGLFVACSLARSYWSTRSHRRVFDLVFKKPDEEIYPNGEPKLLKKKLIFHMSMTTWLCNLQARPVMQALLTIPKKIQIMRESSQKNFIQRNTARSN